MNDKEINEKIGRAIKLLCENLNMEFTEIDFFNLSYESGLDLNASFASRMGMCLYIELIKAGIIK